MSLNWWWNLICFKVLNLTFLRDCRCNYAIQIEFQLKHNWIGVFLSMKTISTWPELSSKTFEMNLHFQIIVHSPEMITKFVRISLNWLCTNFTLSIFAIRQLMNYVCELYWRLFFCVWRYLVIRNEFCYSQIDSLNSHVWMNIEIRLTFAYFIS